MLSNDGSDDIYPASEDTHILIDALLQEKDIFMNRGGRACFCLEIGIGNGEVTKKLTAAYGCAVFGVDVNELAVKRIAASTDVSLSSIELIRGDLVSWARTTTAGLFDVVFFNPPYVATDAEEMRRARTCRDIAASWAGGDDGREVINEILRTVRSVLVDQGVFYLVVERANNVNEILDLAASCGLGSGGVVLSRNAGMELLHVLRFICPKI